MGSDLYERFTESDPIDHYTTVRGYCITARGHYMTGCYTTVLASGDSLR
jgi:hypothetical protein